METNQPFQIGINYWPVRAGLRMWNRFDQGEIGEHLDRLAEWALNPIRIFLLWEDFQPGREQLNPKAFHRLARLADQAADRGLRLWITLFAGHLHGVNWLPGWMVREGTDPAGSSTLVNGFPVDGRPREPWNDSRLITAQQILLREVLAIFHSHPALGVIDLGDRMSSLFASAQTEQARDMLGRLLDPIRTADEGIVVSLGIQIRDLLIPTGFRPDRITEFCDRLVMSTAPGEVSWASGPEDIAFALYAAELTRMLAKDVEVWSSGLTMPTTGDGERFARRSLECLRQNGAPGVLWWAYADHGPATRRKPPFDVRAQEARPGLLNDDWKPKESLTGLLSASRERPGQRPDSGWFDVDPDWYWRDPVTEIKRLYDRFRERLVWPQD